MFTASTNARNFKFVVILKDGICWLVYKDTDILIMLRTAREHVYHSGAYATFECNTQWLTQTGAHAIATRDCAPPVQACLKIIRVKCTVVNH